MTTKSERENDLQTLLSDYATAVHENRVFQQAQLKQQIVLMGNPKYAEEIKQRVEDFTTALQESNIAKCLHYRQVISAIVHKSVRGHSRHKPKPTPKLPPRKPDSFMVNQLLDDFTRAYWDKDRGLFLETSHKILELVYPTYREGMRMYLQLLEGYIASKNSTHIKNARQTIHTVVKQSNEFLAYEAEKKMKDNSDRKTKDQEVLELEGKLHEALISERRMVTEVAQLRTIVKYYKDREIAPIAGVSKSRQVALRNDKYKATANRLKFVLGVVIFIMICIGVEYSNGTIGLLAAIISGYLYTELGKP